MNMNIDFVVDKSTKVSNKPAAAPTQEAASVPPAEPKNDALKAVPPPSPRDSSHGEARGASHAAERVNEEYDVFSTLLLFFPFFLETHSFNL